MLEREDLGQADDAAADTEFSTPTGPSSDFSMIAKSGKKGRAKVLAVVPGAGTVEAGPPSDQKPRLKPATATAEDAGEVAITLKPTGKAKKRLAKKGELKAAVEVTYSPEGGSPASQTATLKLKG